MPDKPKVLVTGCSKGLGRYIVIALYEANYYVIGISRSPYDSLDERLKQNLSEYHSLDLNSSIAVSEFIDNLPLLRAIFLNACHRSFNRFDIFSSKEVYDSINSSFTHQLLILHSVIKKMVGKEGAVVFINSKAAYKGFSKGSLYCSVKAAWLSVFESCSRDYRNENIRFINFVPDSFSDTNANIFPFNDKVETRIKKVINNLTSQKINEEVKVFTIKSQLFLTIIRLKNLISI